MGKSFTYNGTDLGSSPYDLTVLSVSQWPGQAEPRGTTFAMSGADGGRLGTPFLQPMTLTLECIVEGSSQTDLLENFNRIKGILDPRNGEKLLVLDSETGIATAVNRAYFARLNGPIHLVSQTFGYLKFQLVFLIPSGHAVQPITTTQSAAQAATAPYALTVPATDVVPGTDYCRPVWTITAGAALSYIALTNSTTIETLRWTGILSTGHMLRIDSERQHIEKSTDAGSTWTSAISGMTVGDPFPRLKPAVANSISLSRTPVDGLITLSLTYRGAFL